MKPEPPVDLWAQMETALKDAGLICRPDPEKAFGSREFQEKFKITPSAARVRLDKLVEAGKIRKIGIYRKEVYYEFV